ncbi:HlyD family type I secretion periplasmic adaptor subunit [Sulfitobacter sp.]|uniref:HlyD family type I secretion periplasmic adaptor subunit n=1 Tax=Sulfitobacter sp. TaxID=1903071 RepID=UPI003F6BABB9
MSTVEDFETLVRDMRGRSSIRSSLLLLAIISMIIVGLLWASVTELEEVTRGNGRIVPPSNIQVVQSVETGVLTALHAREGDIVEEGALLMELDRTMLTSQYAQELQRARALQSRISRLEAEIAGHDVLDLPPDLISASIAVARTEIALFEARRAELAAEIDVLERQRIQSQQQRVEGEIEVTSAKSAMEMIDQEIAMMRPLVERQMEPETTLLDLSRQRSDVDGRLARSEAALVRYGASLDEIDDQIAALRARFRSQALNDLALANAELAELETRLPALEQRVARSEIRAPVRGVVNQINLTTIGGVAQAGEPMVEIVPLDDTVLVEAYIRPSDIAFLYPGQPVKVKITAYDYSRYGGLEGEIVRIGADAVQRPDRDEQAFVVEIRTSSNILDADDRVVEITPGMVAEVDILAGSRTVLEYLTTPIVRVKDRAFRE